MTITKFGHSCLLIEENGVHILLDPGFFSKGQNSLTGIDVILITHEHGDHVDVNSLKEVLANNPNAKIFTTAGTQAMLEKEGIASTTVTHGTVIVERDVTIEGVGEKHAVLINGVPQIDNTGFIIAGKFFYPGDALTLPGKPIEVLGLPTAAPWSKLSEVVDYAKAVKPQKAIPVHDAILANPTMMQGAFVPILQNEGIEFIQLDLEKPYEF